MSDELVRTPPKAQQVERVFPAIPTDRHFEGKVRDAGLGVRGGVDELRFGVGLGGPFVGVRPGGEVGGIRGAIAVCGVGSCTGRTELAP